MADETLRMQAEVQDKFSGPLKALRAQLLDLTRTGANHSDSLAKGFKGVEGAMQSTARTASTLINPAFAALGVTGLTAGAAVAGIANALNKLTGNLSGLGQLTRDTGIAAKTLQEFGAVAGRFGIEQDAVANGARNFAAQMRLFSRSTGEAFQWIVRQGTDAAGRKAFQDFATDLQRTTDEGEKLKKALSFMETIRNPVERGIFAQQFFGNQDLGRLADGHLGKVVDLFKKAREKIGVFNPDDILNAEKFDRSISDLQGSMSRFGLLIARELLGPATQFTAWINELVSDQRGDLLKGLREGLQGIKEELAQINFKQAGDDAVAFLKESVRLAGGLAKAFHEIAESIHALREGRYGEVFRRLDGASGPLARGLAPLPGDDKLALNEQANALQARIARAREQGGLQTELLKDLDERGDKEGAKRLREAMEANNRQLKALEDALKKLTDQGAILSKSSAEGGPFGGATIQTAAFGGSGFRRFGSGGGGLSLPGTGSGERPGISPIGPRPDLPRGGGAARTGQMMSYAMDQLRKEGVPEGRLREAAAHLVGQATMESGLDPNKIHDGGTGYGIYGARDPKGWGSYRGARRSDMVRWLDANGFARNSAEGQMREMAHSAMSGRYPRTRSILMGRGSGDLESDTNSITREFESPAVINRRIGAVRDALRMGPSATKTGGADGAGWAAREAARKTYEAQQAEAAGLRLGGARVAAAAAQAGVAGTPKVEVSGSVTNVVERPGPDTRIRTTATGNLFQDVVQRSGAQMRRAD